MSTKNCLTTKIVALEQENKTFLRGIQMTKKVR